ncbi:MAG: hypothetical protein COA88_01160 [Kordia sp.]|nr:MAG: hypothetical protein COA88_01160 [Kordia sp.]
MRNLKTIGLSILILCSLPCKADTEPVKNNTEELNKTIKFTEKSTIKVALLLDTSNSMDGLIDQARAQLWEIVNELSYARCNHKSPDLKIALYEYGNDLLSNDNGYIRQVSAFTSDLDYISEKLFSLTTNGGNEYCGQAIQTAVNELTWGSNESDLKLIFIAGNEPFTQGPVNYMNASTKAKEKQININTIYCGDYNDGITSMWQHSAKLTNGDYMSINQSQHTVHIPSPYDDYILELNIKLNKTYIPYGKQGRIKVASQALQDSNASKYGKANEVSRTISKSSSFYKNSSWDLVDAETEGKNFSYSKIDKQLLPEELQGKSDKELQTYVIKKKTERNLIKQQIQEENSKRKKYIATEKKKSNTNNNLESAMLKAIKRQGKQKNYHWIK